MDNTVNAGTPVAPVKKKRRGASLTERRSRLGWVFLAPFIAGLLLFYISIVFDTLQFSFASYHSKTMAEGGGYYLEWVGFENYKHVLTTLELSNGKGETVPFLEVLGQSILNQFSDIITIILLSLFVAVLLNQKMIGKTVFRAIFFVPVVIGAGIIAKIDADNLILTAQMSGEMLDDGSVNASAFSGLVSAMDISMLFQNLGIGEGLVEFVVNLVSDIYDIVNRSGVQMLIFLAGLQSISPSIYESCQMEGATGWETFWKITFPMISPMILANSVYTVIDSLTSESNTLMQGILGMANEMQQAAASCIYFLVMAILLGIVAFICSRFVFYQRRND